MSDFYGLQKGQRRTRINNLVQQAVRKFKVLQQRAFLRRPLKDALSELKSFAPISDEPSMVLSKDVISLSALSNWQKQNQAVQESGSIPVLSKLSAIEAQLLQLINASVADSSGDFDVSCSSAMLSTGGAIYMDPKDDLFAFVGTVFGQI